MGAAAAAFIIMQMNRERAEREARERRAREERDRRDGDAAKKHQAMQP